MNQSHSQMLGRDERLAELILQYMDTVEAGQLIDRDEFLSANMEFRGELEQYFANRDLLERVAAPIRHAAIADHKSTLNLVVSRSLRGTSVWSGGEYGEALRPMGQLGEFRLLREIGRGGMGIVYEADQLSLQRRVALKVLPFAAAIDSKHVLRFKNEALAAAMLNHPHIVPVYSVGNEHGVHFYSMQLVEGHSLASLIAELRRRSIVAPRPISNATVSQVVLANPQREEGATRSAYEETKPEFMRDISTQHSKRDDRFFRTAVRLMLQAAEALQHAHESGIIHRDIKPANLLVDLNGELRITDFGLAQIRSEVGLTRTGDTPGTLRYMSPEQAAGRRAIVDHRTDIYSLGATFYELLTLSPIFEGQDIQELLAQIFDQQPQPLGKLDKSVPAELEIIVLKATSKSADDRYQTAQELVADLQRYLHHEPILAKPPSIIQRTQKWAKRHPSAVVSGLVALSVTSLVSLIAFALVSRAYHRERLRADEAEAQYHLARRSVDELVHVSEEELAFNPATESARRRLLTTVLSYYQDFIEQRRGDIRAQADLGEATRRVERILQGLRALRVSGQIKLLRQPLVVEELRLGDAQRAEVEKLVSQAELLLQDTLRNMGQTSAAELDRRFVERSRMMEADLKAILAPDQLRRLYQLDLQEDFAAALCEPEVQSKIRVTAEQRDRIKTIEQQEMAYRKGVSQHNEISESAAANPPTARILSKNERILGVLNADQVVTWRELTGPPLAGSSR